MFEVQRNHFWDLLLQAILERITDEEKEMFKSAFSEYDKNGDGSINTKEVTENYFMLKTQIF